METILPETSNEDRLILGNILGQTEYDPMTKCVVWQGAVQKPQYPLFLHYRTNTMAIRPFIYRCFSDANHPKGKGRIYLKMSCNTPRCISPDHVVRRDHVVKSEYYENKEKSNGRLLSRYGHIIRRQ